MTDRPQEPQWTPDDFCYLCGRQLTDRLNADHVPPKRIFPSAIRAKLKGVDLLTLKTHPECQKAYQWDEEYFFTTLLPDALWSTVGNQLAEDFKDLIGPDKPSAKLSETVRRQFEDRPSGLVLPGNMVIQRVQGSRLFNIAWKIARGLFAFHNRRFLPDTTPKFIKMHGPFDGDLPDYMKVLVQRSGRGHSRECFAYQFADTDEISGWSEEGKAHVWLMNFWETHLFFVGFHDPTCDCDKCTTA